MSSDRLHELLAERAVYGLDRELEEELERSLAGAPESDDGSFERAAGAVHLALVGKPVALPGALRERLRAQAAGYAAAVAAPRPRLVAGGAAPPAADRAAQGSRLALWGGWLAAAALLLAFLVPRALGPASGPRDPLALRRELVAHAGGLVQVAWSPTEDPLGQGVEGDVVWSDDSDQGVMLFRHLPPNDPREHQYQLWIFDRDRPDEYPVDGGVFDVPAGVDEVAVPIRAKLDIAHPTLFAVTLEQPGGVVVSSRERLLLVAAVD